MREDKRETKPRESKINHFSLFHYWLVSKMPPRSLKVVNLLELSNPLQRQRFYFGDNTSVTAIQDSRQLSF